jgi:hypothetical protein
MAAFPNEPPSGQPVVLFVLACANPNREGRPEWRETELASRAAVLCGAPCQRQAVGATLRLNLARKGLVSSRQVGHQCRLWSLTDEARAVRKCVHAGAASARVATVACLCEHSLHPSAHRAALSPRRLQLTALAGRAGPRCRGCRENCVCHSGAAAKARTWLALPAPLHRSTAWTAACAPLVICSSLRLAAPARARHFSTRQRRRQRKRTCPATHRRVTAAAGRESAIRRRRLQRHHSLFDGFHAPRMWTLTVELPFR